MRFGYFVTHIESLIPFLGRYIRIDIDKDIVKFNRKEIDDKSRKNIARDLRSLIPELSYRFKKGILLNEKEKLAITVKTDDIEIKREEFKNSYKNIQLYYNVNYGDLEECYLKEGCRYLSLEEMRHVIDLIYRPEGTIFSLGVDLYTNVEKNGG